MEGLMPACSCRAQGHCPVCRKPLEVALRCSLRRYLEVYPPPVGATRASLGAEEVKALLEEWRHDA
jgi:hypothetical protein